MNRVGDIIHLSYAHERGIFGQGIGVAVVDTGISAHPDFSDKTSRVLAFADFINGRSIPYDDNGHGTHVSGIIGGNGISSEGRYTGIAPKCNFISVKVLNYRGGGDIPDVVRGFDWIIKNRQKYNIRIVNVSVGSNEEKKYEEDSILVKKVNEVWDAGIVVLAAAGNNGPKTQSIGAPGISRKIITVGSSDDSIMIEMNGSRVSDYSGRGPTDSCVKKPDIVAPGSNIVSCNLIKNNRGFSGGMFSSRRMPYNNLYTVKSGTSMATPIVSGAVALLLSKYPTMNNREVKIRLKNSSVDLGWVHEKQGWGMIDVERLLTYRD